VLVERSVIAVDEVDKLFVDLGDRTAVCALLARVNGLVVAEMAISEGLQLAKLGLHARGGFASVVAPLIEATDAGTSPGAGPVEQLTRSRQLDILLGHIRDTPPEGFVGPWAPVVGRDHDVGEHGLNPHVKIADDVPPVEFAPVTQSDRVPLDTPTGPRIGIADAVLYAHRDLVGRFRGESLADHGPYDAPGPGHASVVAGTVLRHCPKAQLVAHQVLIPTHDGANSSWEVAERLLRFVDDDLDVLNMSFGCLSDGQPSLPLQRAIERLGQRTVLVAALGNYDAGDDRTLEHYPAAFASVVAVGAADTSGIPADITPRVPWLDVLGPNDVVGPFLIGDVGGLRVNGRLVTRHYDSGYVSWSGSSFSAAAVSGTIAQLMLEQDIDATAARDVVLSGAAQIEGVFVSAPGRPA
jgi:hypothetical protein